MRKRETWEAWRAHRTSLLRDWHKGRRAELHRWATLMRVVLLAWLAWRELHAAGLERLYTCLQAQADRLCAKCLAGWIVYTERQQAKRHALLFAAGVLQRRCLAGWAGWMGSRLAKRPRRAELMGRARLKALASAHARWGMLSATHSAWKGSLQLGAAEGSRFEKCRAIGCWRRSCTRRCRAALLSRRAYLFMASYLLGRIVESWKGLLFARAAIAALLPRAEARLCRIVSRHFVWRWSAATQSALSHLDNSRLCARAVALVGGRVALHRLSDLAASRRRRLSSLQAAASGVKVVLTGRSWRGWIRAYEAREMGRVLALRRARGMRRWRGFAVLERALEDSLSLASAHASYSAKMGDLSKWKHFTFLMEQRVAMRRLEASIARRHAHHVQARALGTWIVVGAALHRGELSCALARRCSLSRPMHIWREEKDAEEARDMAWRRGVRHQYLTLLRRDMCVWRLHLACALRMDQRVKAGRTSIGRKAKRRALAIWLLRAATDGQLLSQARDHVWCRAGYGVRASSAPRKVRVWMEGGLKQCIRLRVLLMVFFRHSNDS